MPPQSRGRRTLSWRGAASTSGSHSGRRPGPKRLRALRSHLSGGARTMDSSGPIADQRRAKWRLDESQCVGCAICADVCPEGALQMGRRDLLPRFNAGACTRCGTCAEQCPTGAIEVTGPHRHGA